MELTFTNRTAELNELEAAATAGGLLVVFGRRRVGKTRLLAHWLKPRHGLYSQAIEGAKETQLEQVFRDIQDRLTTTIVPKSWAELFELLALQKQQLILCLDEFPYLVASDPSLPSVDPGMNSGAARAAPAWAAVARNRRRVKADFF